MPTRLALILVVVMLAFSLVPTVSADAPPPPLPPEEQGALLALYEATQGAQWGWSDAWRSAADACAWFGVTCADGHVTELRLPNNRLRGSLPPALGQLTHLRRLDLSQNQLSGAVPAALTTLTELRELDLAFNQLTAIPDELGQLPALATLRLNDNSAALTLGPRLTDLAAAGIVTSGSTAPAGASSTCVPRADAIRPKVLIITYNPWLTTQGMSLFAYESNYNPSITSEQMRQDFCQASDGFVDLQIVDRIDRAEFPLATDGGRLTEPEYLTLRQAGRGYFQTHNGAMVDMPHIMDENGVPTRIAAHTVDEVWVFMSWTMSLYESYMGGPGAFWINGPTFPSPSRRAYAVMGFETAVGVPNSLHSIGHRVESTLDQAYGYYEHAPDTPWARFRKHSNLPANAIPAFPYGVGDTENPPNSTHPYDYTNLGYVQSSAADWLNYPALTGATTSLNATGWGVTDYGYYKWWYGHMPKVAGQSARAPAAPTTLRENNWWKYIFQFNRYPYMVGAENVDPGGQPGGIVFLPLTQRPAPPVATGTLGPWQDAQSIGLPFAAPFETNHGQELISYNGYAYIFGGRSATAPRLRSVFKGAIMGSGAFTEWMNATPLPREYYDQAVARIGNHLYLVSGAAGATDVWHTTIHDDSSLAAWSPTTSLPESRQNFALAAHGNRLYAIGGNAMGTRNFVQTAVAGPAGVGAWLDTVPLPAPTEGHAATVIGDRLYVVTTDAQLYVADLGPDGITDGWSAYALPFVCSGHSTFGANGRLYIMGGGQDVWFAQLAADGSPAEWQKTQPLPLSLSGMRAGATGGRVYAIGGWDGSQYQDVAYMASIQ